MKFLLDENLPLSLYRRLREKSFDVEHIIELGQRGVPDSALRVRLAAEELVFLTNDAERVEIWIHALEQFASRKRPERLFDLMPDGQVLAWEIKEGTRRAKTDPSA